MTIKNAVYETLDRLRVGEDFTGADLYRWAVYRKNMYCYIATALRYLRYYRRSNRKVKCINRAKSIYMIVEE